MFLSKLSVHGFTHIAEYLGSKDCYIAEFHKCLLHRNEDGETPFLLASYHGHLDLIKYFHHFVKGQRNGNATQLLRTPNRNLDSPLMRATQQSQYDVCKYLLENGAKPRRVKCVFKTPMYWALRKNYDRIVGLLQQY